MIDDKSKPKKKDRSKYSYSRKNFWDKPVKKDLEKTVFDFAEDYKQFISDAKTERESVKVGSEILKRNGFRKSNFFEESEIAEKFYFTHEEKTLVAGQKGKSSLMNGINFVMAHVDSPRLDMKPLAIYEKGGFTLMKTHYYGGVKKYQWVTLPLAIHGVVYLENGEKIELNIGEKDEDPVFKISDLLPHLAYDQMKKDASKVIEAEELNVITSSIQNSEKKKDKFKEALLKILNKKYGVREEDFISAEISFVPAGKARDFGFDRSMILGYGHDDRSCAYTSIKSLIDSQKFERMNVTLWIDKEEIGSEGNTSIQGNLLRLFVAKLLDGEGIEPNELNVSTVLAKSHAISADVDAVADPTFGSADEPLNTARINNGVILTKYTGYGGKYSSNDANADFVAKIRKVLNDNKVNWQPGLLGQVDKGGGGTIAKYLARHLVNVVDMGPGVLSMHAPWEAISKSDLYSTYLSYRAFFKDFK